MCFFSKQGKDAQTLEHRFNAKFDDPAMFAPTDHYDGFTFPKTPVITNKDRELIQMFNWGLLPSWTKDIEFRKYTLNAKIETIHEKPSFRNSLHNRCLILADGFYEWQWLDEKGKKKQKYLITLPGDEPFAFAGLWNNWTDRQTGEILHTYTLLTTEANELMSRIHNSKKRMPMILSPAEEALWLGNEAVSPIREIELRAVEIGV